MDEANIIKAAHDNDVQRLLFLAVPASSQVHRAADPQESLLTGPLGSLANEPYALPDRGIKLCEFQPAIQADYRSIMPTNLRTQDNSIPNTLM